MIDLSAPLTPILKASGGPRRSQQRKCPCPTNQPIPGNNSINPSSPNKYDMDQRYIIPLRICQQVGGRMDQRGGLYHLVAAEGLPSLRSEAPCQSVLSSV
jgi:hypothetical protein